MALQIRRGADGNEAVIIGGQIFPVAQSPRQVEIPSELLEGLHLSDLPDEIAIVPLGVALPALSLRSSCQLYAFRDGMAWIRIGIAASTDAEGITALDCLRQAARERQERRGDIEEDALQEFDLQHCLFYVVPFSGDIAIGDGLARAGTIARELDERCRELMRWPAQPLKRGQSAAE
jgi:hypothetical protein